MIEMLSLWLLSAIVIAIAWGGIDRITFPIKALVRSLQRPERSRRLEILVASFLAIAVFSIIMAATDHGIDSIREWANLPAMLVWIGGLWLIPFRLDVIQNYWLISVAIGVLMTLMWIGNSSRVPLHAPLHRHARITGSARRGQEISPSVTGKGFLFWILVIGLTVAAIAKYTSTWNAVALNS